MDVTNSVTDCWWRLGFLSLADLDAVDSYVKSNELYGFADEAAKLLASRTGAFLTTETLAVTAGLARYILPPANLFTLAVFLDGKDLRISPWRELAALDAQWVATSGTPTRASFDADAPGLLTLYPRPTAGGTLTLICAEAPATITAGASTVNVPQVFQDYFSFAALAGARGKESEGRQEEMSDHYAARAELYRTIGAYLFGPGA